MNFSLPEITAAYRKAKADAWLRHDLNEEAYFWFEQSFRENILAFKGFMESCAGRDSFSIDWLGGWRLMAKKIEMKDLDQEEDMAISSDPNENFKNREIKHVAYRLMASPSVNFQILSSLWILRVGWKYEKRLLKHVYGNRLRPLEKRTGRPNLATRGSFRFYRPMFTKWKRDGIESLNAILKGLNGGRAIVVTADAKAFFHSLKPDFLLDKKFLSGKGIVLTQEDRELTQLLIDAINVWAEATPLTTGLPVGLAASSVIANIALLDFDECFERLDGKVFYGRYVDDLLLVFRNQSIRTRSDVWEYIARSSSMFRPLVKERLVKDESKSPHVTIGVEFAPVYERKLTDTKIVFTGEKCRAFFLDATTGPSFVETLNSQIQDVTSEFRYLPRNIFDEDDVERKIQKLLTKDGEEADNFRKIDILTLRKKDLKELLREMRFLLQTLPPEAWKKQRRAFYRLVIKHLMLPTAFVEYAERDFPQIITMATLCGDFAEMTLFFGKVFAVCDKLKKQNAVIAGHADVAVDQDAVTEKWIKELFSKFAASIKTAFRDTEDSSYNDSYHKFVEECKGYFVKNELTRLVVAKTWARQCILHDMAAHSYVEHLYRSDVRPLTSQAKMWRCSALGFIDLKREFRGWFDEKYVNAAVLLGQHASWPKRIDLSGVPFALLFPTRPIAERDIAWINNWRPLQDVGEIFTHLRGYSPVIRDLERIGGGTVLSKVVDNRNIVNPTVALLNIKTDDKFCCHNIKEIAPTRYYERLKEIVAVINVVISQKEKVDYLVTHELSLPMRWFLAIAGHCTDHGISLIAGATYNVTDEKKKLCKNEVCMALVRSSNGSFCQPEFICEAKTAFSREEAYNLKKQYGYMIDDRIPIGRHVIVRHGDFAFSTLICSELTEISNRNRLRGLVDALFVVEWNPDLHSFAAIVESTAIDLHAYVVQSNNNLYGDSRIRAPRNKVWARDIVRLRGGEGAFCVVGKLDVAALRQFQLSWDPAEYFKEDKKENSLTFKPIPIGYENDMADYRCVVRKEVRQDSSDKGNDDDSP